MQARKATGLKSLRINCWEINQEASKCQMGISGKTFKKRPKTDQKNITIEFYLSDVVCNHSETDSSFRVKWPTAGGVQFLFSGDFY